MRRLVTGHLSQAKLQYREAFGVYPADEPVPTLDQVRGRLSPEYASGTRVVARGQEAERGSQVAASLAGLGYPIAFRI
jgi:hypothetical protein